MKRFWLGLIIALFFYVKMDILIWQRIFETHELISYGIGVYQWGWIQGLFGFMALGALLFFPDWRRMVTFPLSLGILAFSGMEDVLYYWLDGKSIPILLPWLSSNPMVIHPVTADNLVISAGLWLLVVIALDLTGEIVERKIKNMRKMKLQLTLETPLPEEVKVHSQ